MRSARSIKSGVLHKASGYGLFVPTPAFRRGNPTRLWPSVKCMFSASCPYNSARRRFNSGFSRHLSECWQPCRCCCCENARACEIREIQAKPFGRGIDLSGSPLRHLRIPIRAKCRFKRARALFPAHAPATLAPRTSTASGITMDNRVQAIQTRACFIVGDFPRRVTCSHS